MVDIWSGIGAELSKPSGEWLYRVGGEVRGPVPIKVLAEKLIKGELSLTTPVAVEGGDFYPVVQVTAFAVHITEAKKAARKRNAIKMRRVMMVLGLMLIAGGGVGGFFIYKEYKQDAHERVLAEKKRLDDERLKEEERQKRGKLELVALVTLGTAEEVKIKAEPKRGVAPKSKGITKPGSKEPVEETPAGKSDQMVSSCERGTNDILGALSKHVSKLNVCVVEEKKGPEGNLLPAKLVIEFVVRPDGKVVDFGIDDRHYRTGPLKNCMTKVFNTIKYDAAGGSNCPVTLPLNIGS